MQNKLSLIEACKRTIAFDFPEGITLDDDGIVELLDRVEFNYPEIKIPEVYSYLQKRLVIELKETEFGIYKSKKPMDYYLKNKQVVNKQDADDKTECIKIIIDKMIVMDGYTTVDKLFEVCKNRENKYLKQQGIKDQRDLIEFVIEKFPFEYEIQAPHILKYLEGESFTYRIQKLFSEKTSRELEELKIMFNWTSDTLSQVKKIVKKKIYFNEKEVEELQTIISKIIHDNEFMNCLDLLEFRNCYGVPKAIKEWTDNELSQFINDKIDGIHVNNLNGKIVIIIE